MSPGSWLYRLARRWLDEEDVERIVAPAIADLQAECEEARGGRAVWLRLAGTWHVVRAAVHASLARRGAAFVRLSWGMVVPALLLGVAGVLLVGGLTAPFPAVLATQQLAYLGIGAAALLVIGTGGTGGRPATPLVAGGLALVLVLAVAAWGESVFGARRWLVLGPLRLQVGAWSVPLVVAALAGLLARPRPALLRAAVLLAAVGGAIAWQPDLATAIALGAAALAMAGSVGRRGTALLGAVAAAVVTVAAVRQAAMGGVGWAGLEPLAAALRVASFVGPAGDIPVRLAHTDGILAVAVLHAGLLGFGALVALLAAVVTALVGAAGRASSPRLRMVGAGVTAAFTAQVLAHLVLGEGMLLVSYGGSSVVATLALLGMAARRDQAASAAIPASSRAAR